MVRRSDWLACVAWRFERARKQAKVGEGSETARGLVVHPTKPPWYASPHLRKHKTVLDHRIPGTGFRSLSVELGY